MSRTLRMLSVLLVLGFPILVWGQQEAAPNNSGIADLARRAAESMKKAKVGKAPTRVLVWVCTKPVGPVNEFALSFARDFSNSLATALKQNAKFVAGIQADHLAIGEIVNSADLQSELVAQRFATSKGYDLLVLGMCEAKDNEVNVELRILNIVANRKLKSVRGVIPKSPEVVAQLGQPIKLASAKSSDDAEVQVHTPGLNGVSVPECEYCPNPAFPPAAGDSQGSVILQLVVTADGRAEKITFVKRINPYLDDAAVNAVRQWKFKPGMLDGKPVASWTNIEMNFRQF